MATLLKRREPYHFFSMQWHANGASIINAVLLMDFFCLCFQDISMHIHADILLL